MNTDNSDQVIAVTAGDPASIGPDILSYLIMDENYCSHRSIRFERKSKKFKKT